MAPLSQGYAGSLRPPPDGPAPATAKGEAMLGALLAHDTIWFTAPALLGTAVFAIKLLFMLVGAGGDIDIDIDLDHGDPTDAFKVLSIQSVAAFLMGFGWG